jgi:hypothetical protein
MDPNGSMDYREVDSRSNAEAYVRAQSPQMSTFFTTMANTIYGFSNHFTYGELNGIWPRDEKFWSIAMPKQIDNFTILNYTANWNSPTIETFISYGIMQIIPGLITEILLTKLLITITNKTINGQPAIVPYGHEEMFPGTMNSQKMTYLLGLVDIEIIKGLIEPWCYEYEVTIEINVIGNTSINISVNGGPSTPFNAPTFCSSMVSPMVGRSQEDLDSISETIETIVEELIPDKAGYYNSHHIHNSNNHLVYGQQDNHITNPYKSYL